MGKNKSGGNKAKKMKNKPSNKGFRNKGQLVTKDIDQCYCYVEKRLGGNRLLVFTDKGEERQVLIPGKFMKRMWIHKEDILLVEKSPYDDAHYVVLKYDHSQAKKLEKLKELGKLVEYINDKAVIEGNVDKTKQAFVFNNGTIEEDDEDLEVNDFYKGLNKPKIKKVESKEQIINIDDI